MRQQKQALLIFLILFTISGFSGLIYESIWTHYLKLYLGHSSFAQVLVLSIFMGGMAIGAFTASKYGDRSKNLILWYGIIEGIVGLFGLLFHNVFLSVQSVSFDVIFPLIESPALVNLSKWTIASLLILPQSILLGATFPLLTAGLLRRFPDQKGRLIASFYFANSLGAAVGILANVFIFIPKVGLPGAVLTAGLINIALALVIYFLTKNDNYPAPKPVAQNNKVLTTFEKSLLVVAALTGLASFMYEISWIRMLTMVLGGSTHSFEIMLSAFILGLAIGGFLIRRYINKLKNPMLTLGLIQLLMGAFAMATIPLYNLTFDFMSNIINALGKTDQAYSLYTVFSYGISLFVMLPATICAGTTLPLVTYLLLKNNSSDSAIGRVYAWNTIGSIIGVALAVVLVMPLMGLKWVIAGGAFVDIGLGLTLIYFASKSLNLAKRQSFIVIAACSVFIFCLSSGLSVEKMASGVYRSGAVSSAGNVLFHKDGKASTVAIKEYAGTVVVLNNGKPDAGIIIDNDKDNTKYTEDESTMIMLGTLPFVYSPKAQNIANIGLGSGLTTHTILQHGEVKQLDTIEIEQAVVDAAVYFRPNVDNIFTDKRSHIIIDDAKTYFSANGKQYDVIVSEPPNPWVSGVSGLFTTEFYKEMNQYLTPDGILVQWLHLYEMTPELVATIYRALQQNYSNIHFYQTAGADIALVAANRPLLPNYDSLFNQEALKKDLNEISIMSANDLKFRLISTKHKLDAIFNSQPGETNSDFFPILDVGAAKARFMKLNARSLYELRHTPALDFALNKENTKSFAVTADTSVRQTNSHNFGQKAFNDFISFANETKKPSDYNPPHTQLAVKLFKATNQCDSQVTQLDSQLRTVDFIEASLSLVNHLSTQQRADLFELSQQCESHFDPKGQTWLQVNLALATGDIKTVAALTSAYIDSKHRLQSKFDYKILTWYLASKVKLNDTTQVSETIQKTSLEIETKQDVRALIYLLFNS